MVKGGIVLGKRYEVLSKIGAGGMADVYKGKDTILNRYVAIKVLKKEYREDENFVRKFRSEAQAAAGLMNPNIVNVYDVGEDRGLYYMVMELVEGITLKEYIKRKGKLSHKEIISIAIQMCTGIGAAHAANIIHRDIKPQNIIISKDGKVKVTDFGIAKATTSNTISSNAMGSVHYTSPEQARGGFSDAKSDIYSIGITLFEMATGRVPFDGDSTVSVAIKHLQEEITPPSEFVPDIPYSLEQIILKCTQKNSERRYANTDDLIRDLKKSLVDPDGDFVIIPPLRNADTVIITDEELDDIRSNYDDEYDDDEYADDEYGYEDEQYTESFDDEYDEEGYDDYDTETKRGKRKGSEEVNPRMKKVMRILTIVVAVIIVFIIIFSIGKAAGIFKSFGQGTLAEETVDEVKVPSVLGMTEDEAKEALNKKGLGIKVVGEEESDKYGEGMITKQTPNGGEKVKKNTKVEVIISSGLTKEEVEVPDVKGMDEDDAQKVLEDKGLKVGTPDFVYSDDYAEGEVIETTPAAGSKVAKDTEIIMKVSKGSEKVTVPNVVGKSDADAQSALSAAGLEVTATYDYHDTVAKGKVVSQTISSGNKVAKGTEIGILISNGKKPEEKVNIPNLSGKTYQQAKALLESYGLVAVNGGEEESEEEIGKVSRWEPYNTSVKKGTKVTIWISSGYDEPDPGTGDEPANGTME
ncbi:MAG: Stk1 family PASTA domain-containing Ser/Thr kinase [Lachnospiraceae bacterium]